MTHPLLLQLRPCWLSSKTLIFLPGSWRDTPLWIADGSHPCSVQSEPFNKTLISVTNLKTGMLKESIFNLALIQAH